MARGYRSTALVISGGGARGAFAVGVLADTYERHRESGWFSIIGGASTGALITPFAALLAAPKTLADQVMERLIRSYTTVETSDLLGRRSWIGILRHRNSFNDTAPLRKMITDALEESWFEWLRRPEAPECYVVYTNFTTGEKVTAAARQRGMTRDRFINAMLASASVPVVMSATEIDGSLCYDGCLRDLLPVEHAVDLGAEVIVPIYLEPVAIGEPAEPPTKLEAIIMRAITILVNEVGRNDVEIPRLQSVGVQMRDRLQSIRELVGRMMPTRRTRALRAEIDRLLNDPALSPLLSERLRVRRIVDGVRPAYQLGQDALQFHPEEMRRWMTHGREVSRQVLADPPFVER
jgi:NTE family protein